MSFPPRYDRIASISRIKIEETNAESIPVRNVCDTLPDKFVVPMKTWKAMPPGIVADATDIANTKLPRSPHNSCLDLVSGTKNGLPTTQ